MSKTNDSQPYNKQPTPAPTTLLNSPPPDEPSNENDLIEQLLVANEELSARLAELEAANSLLSGQLGASEQARIMAEVRVLHLRQRRRRKRTGPPAVRQRTTLSQCRSHRSHRDTNGIANERHPARIAGDGLEGRSDRRSDAPVGGNSERAEGCAEAKGAVVVARPEAVLPAGAKDGFFKRLWRRLIGATLNESAPAIPPPVKNHC